MRSAEEDVLAEITSWFDIGTCLTLVKWYIGLWSEIPKSCDFDCKHDYAKSDDDDVTSAVDELPGCFQLPQYHQFKEECANGDEISVYINDQLDSRGYVMTKSTAME